MSAKPPCPRCGYVHTLHTATSAVGRFTSTPRYRARHDDAPLRDTREEAHRDACDYYTRKEHP